MSSLKSHLVTFVLRHTRKKAFLTADGLNARIKIERPLENHRPPEKLKSVLDIAERQVEGCPVYEVRPKGLADEDCAMRILYFHGGAYVFEINSYHWLMIAEMAERLDARITVPVYPLAPENTFRDIFEPMRALYREAIAETPPEKLVFMGDSAGAHMAVVLTMMEAENGTPSPARLVLISPGFDMSMSNPKIRELEKVDPWLGIDGGLEAIRLYAPGMSRRDWRVSPIFGDVSVLPKTLILTGTLDLLSADTELFAEKARAEGVDVELILEEGMMHVWPLIDMPEARIARDRIVAFLGDIGTGHAAEPAEADTGFTFPWLRQNSTPTGHATADQA